MQGLLHATRAIFAGWWSENNEYSDKLIYGVTVSSIREANAHGCRSLALPMFGGRGGVQDERRARVFARVLRDLLGLKGSMEFPLERLVFSDTTSGRLEVVEDVLDRELYR